MEEPKLAALSVNLLIWAPREPPIFKEENTKGLLGKDLAAAIQDGNSCKIKVLTILTERLLTPAKIDEASRDSQREAKVSDYTVPNSDQFCSRLKELVVSGKKKLKGI
jgi:hypothetical protein